MVLSVLTYRFLFKQKDSCLRSGSSKPSFDSEIKTASSVNKYVEKS